MDTHRVLRVLLYVLATLAAAGSLFLIFGTHWLLGAFPFPADPASRTLLDIVMKAFGGIALGMAWLLCIVARDPVRYVGVIDAFIVLLVLLAAVDAYSATQPQFAAMFPQGLILARIASRLILALGLFALRPRGTRV